jgi:hypothetical protein
MKRDVFFLLVILFCIIFNQLICAETEGDLITGETVTGKMTSQQVGLNIFVQAAPLSIQILSPENQTYLTNESILLSYRIINGNSDDLWYNLDNLENMTLNSSIYLNVSQGIHTLSLYLNNSNEIIENNTSFTANSTIFLILFQNYNGTDKGSSTNFLDYTYEKLQNLDNVTFENTNYGKIQFNQAINVTNDKINTDNLVDIDSNVKISANHIEVNAYELPNFNKPTTLWLYNLNFVNPRILKDNILCPSNLCIIESYSGGTLKFNVTGFSNYSAEETPSTKPKNPSSGGGTYSPPQQIIKEVQEEEPIKNITIISREITISLKQGQGTSENLYLINNYPGNIKIKINTSGVQNFVKANETEFELSYEQVKVIKLDFSTLENTSPDNYVGKILIETPTETYQVIISMNVQSKASLLDVKLELDEQKLPAYRGGSIWFKTSISNLGDAQNIPIKIKYTIKDSNGKIILEGEGTDTINTYLEKNGKIKLPKNIPLGKYILSSKIDYQGKTAIASANFEVKKKKLMTPLNIIIIICIFIIILIILGRIGKKEKKKREQEERKEISKKER